MDVVRGKVEGDEEHDQQRPVVISHGEETQQTSRSTPIRDHVEYGTKFALLS